MSGKPVTEVAPAVDGDLRAALQKQNPQLDWERIQAAIALLEQLRDQGLRRPDTPAARPPDGPRATGRWVVGAAPPASR